MLPKIFCGGEWMDFRHFLPPLLRDAQALGRLGAGRLLAQALTTGAIAGGVIGAFRLLYDILLTWSGRLLRSADMMSVEAAACLAGGLLGLGLLAHALVRHEPLISGSGIPQVELMVMGRLPPMRWARVLWCKFAGTLAALWAGLSLGREGPSIQMGAAVGMGVGRVFHDADEVNLPRHLVGGAVAGLTAAFGAPLAGLCFAFEEMRAPLTLPLLLFVATAAGAAWLVVSFCFGFGLVFPFADVPWLDWTQAWIVVPVGLFSAVLGAGYNRGLLGLTLWEDSLSGLPPLVRSLFPFLLSGLLLYVFPEIVGGTGLGVMDFQDGLRPLWLLLLLLLAKIAFSCVSFASGISGGLLMPMLAAGGMAGACCASPLIACGLLAPGQTPTLLVLGMAGLFAATVRAPLTGAALVVEMAGCHALAPLVVLTAWIAAFTASRLGVEPVYDGLRRRVLLRGGAASVPSPAERQEKSGGAAGA